MRPELREYQSLAVEHGLASLEKGKPEIIMAPTASGKSLIISELCHNLREPVLILQPSKEILEQNFSKLSQYGVEDMKIFSASLGQKEIGQYTYATIGSIKNRISDFKHFRYALVDECFPAGSLVDGIPIETIKKGDMVKSFNHSTASIEQRLVIHTFAKVAPAEMVRITLTNGVTFHCTRTHPIFTEEFGYVDAECLTNGVTLLYEQEEDMALLRLRKRVPPQLAQQSSNLLQQGMLASDERVENPEDRDELLDLWNADCPDSGTESKIYGAGKGLLLPSMLEGRQVCRIQRTSEDGRRKKGCLGEDEIQQSNVDGGLQGKNDSEDEGKDISVKRRKWSAHETAAKVTSRNGNGNGGRYHNGSGERNATLFAPPLQSRSGLPRNHARCGSRRKESQVEEMEVPRQKERTSLIGVRVDCVEIYQREGGQRDGDLSGGDLVYNVEVEGNHNYFVNSVLVHNCDTVGKSDGMYRQFFKKMPRRLKILGLTASPWRMQQRFYTDERGLAWYTAMLRVMTTIHPPFFKGFSFKINIGTLFDKKFLAPLEYSTPQNIDISAIPVNSTGADFREEQLEAFMNSADNVRKLAESIIAEDEYTPNNLIFCSSILHARNTAELLGKMGYDSEVVTGVDPKRDEKVKAFREGKIKRLLNVDVLGIGFDFPGLYQVTLGRPTMSLRVLYQQVGRVMRLNPLDPHKFGKVIDVCNNIRRLGTIESIRITRNPATQKDQIETSRGVMSDRPLFTFKVTDQTKINRIQ